MNFGTWVFYASTIVLPLLTRAGYLILIIGLELLLLSTTAFLIAAALMVSIPGWELSIPIHSWGDHIP
jgi:hypothetical protein